MTDRSVDFFPPLLDGFCLVKTDKTLDYAKIKTRKNNKVVV